MHRNIKTFRVQGIRGTSASEHYRVVTMLCHQGGVGMEAYTGCWQSPPVALPSQTTHMELHKTTDHSCTRRSIINQRTIGT